MKKVINDPKNVVEEMMEGIVCSHPQYVTRVEGYDVLRRTEKKQGKVALVSGGGSGHEPSHAGFVGKGMLDAAVCGAVFTSPTPDQVFGAIDAVKTDAGVLLVIKNYTGDVMNFEMAMEMAQAEGITVEKVIVNDDVAVMNSTYTVGRRGIAGTVLVHKIAGAAAESGKDLQEVRRIAEKVIANVRSMGIALTPCIVPEVGKSGFVLEEDEMELGMGIHGEPGIEKTKLKTADEIASDIVGRILADMPMQEGDETAVLINGLSGTPLMELYLVSRKVHALLGEKGIRVHHTNVGEYMTSLEMAGFSVSVLKLDDELKALYDATADTPAYKVF